jgi:hypothetical protein
MEPVYNKTLPLYRIMRKFSPVHTSIPYFLRSTLIKHYYPPRRDFTLTPLDYTTVILNAFYLLPLVSPTFRSLVKLDNILWKVQMLNRLQPPVTYSPLDPNILLSTMFLSTRHQSNFPCGKGQTIAGINRRKRVSLRSRNKELKWSYNSATYSSMLPLKQHVLPHHIKTKIIF